MITASVLMIQNVTFIVIISFVIITILSKGISAQTVQGVVVDLSVLSDAGISATMSSPLVKSRGLKIPPETTPRSRLHLRPQKAVPAILRPKPRPQTGLKASNIGKTQPMAIRATNKLNEEILATPEIKKLTAPPPTPKEPNAPPPLPKVAKKPPPMPKVANAPTTLLAPAPPIPSAQNKVEPAEINLKPGRALSVVFEGYETKVQTKAEIGLNAVADAMHNVKDYRLQLMAYAGAKELSSSKARRISLSRALAVRLFLINKGVRSTQIDVRALGNKTSEEPVNRVDINVVQR